MSILQAREKGWKGSEVVDPRPHNESERTWPLVPPHKTPVHALPPWVQHLCQVFTAAGAPPGAFALAFCLRCTQRKARVGTRLSLPQGLVKKSDMKLLSYLYCRSTLRHSEAAETATARMGQTWEDTAGSPQPFALHLSKERPRSLQKGMKAALAVLGTWQLPWCSTSTLPLLALGRQQGDSLLL